MTRTFLSVPSSFITNNVSFKTVDIRDVSTTRIESHLYRFLLLLLFNTMVFMYFIRLRRLIQSVCHEILPRSTGHRKYVQSTGARLQSVMICRLSNDSNATIKSGNTMEDVDKMSTSTELIEANASLREIAIHFQQQVAAIDERLDNKRLSSAFKPFLAKQEEIKQLISDIDNVHALFYLFEKHCIQFDPPNFVHFIRRVAFLQKDAPLEILAPADIRHKIVTTLVRIGPNLDANDCKTLFHKFDLIDISVDDQAYKAILQLLKYHVNSFNLLELIGIKKKLSILVTGKVQEQRREDHVDEQNQANASLAKTTNEYVQVFCKALSLAAQLLIDQIETVDLAIYFLKHFHRDISENNFRALMSYVRRNNRKLRTQDRKTFYEILAEHRQQQQQPMQKCEEHVE